MFLYNGNNAQAQRMEYERAKMQLAATPGIDSQKVQDAVLSQSYLRLEQLLTITSSNFKFPILVNDTGNSVGVRATEQRLALQDAFYVSGIGIYLAKAASATDTAFRLKTYPNPVTFTLGGAAPAPLNTFYNGRYYITVNNEVLVPGFPMSKFLDLPQTQLTAAANSPEDQFFGDAVQSLQPNPVFIGQKKNYFNIELPNNISAVDGFTYAVVIMWGVLAQNVTVVS